MTTFAPIKVKCAVCGKESKFSALCSSNTFGGTMDLDTRPPEMMRGTMSHWIQECPKCGYISEEISDETGVDKEFLKSDKYKKCDGLVFRSELAAKFYKYYLLNIADENPKDAFYASLNSAWASDDEGDAQMAIHCRRLCIDLIGQVEDMDEETAKVLTADLHRRCGEFESVINMCEGVELENELLDSIIKFEIEKAKENDSQCYTVGDVTGEE